MLEAFTEGIEKCLGVEAQGAPILIDERQQGRVTYRLEIQVETLSCRPALRLLVTEYSGRDSTQASSQSFSWVVTDARADFLKITSQIIEASQPERQVTDVRGLVGRCVDRLSGQHYVNHIPVLAEQHGPSKHWMHATLRRNQHGVLVTLSVEFKGRSAVSMRLPLDCIKKFHIILLSLPVIPK